MNNFPLNFCYKPNLQAEHCNRVRFSVCPGKWLSFHLRRLCLHIEEAQPGGKRHLCSLPCTLLLITPCWVISVVTDKPWGEKRSVSFHRNSSSFSFKSQEKEAAIAGPGAASCCSLSQKMGPAHLVDPRLLDPCCGRIVSRAIPLCQ